MEDDSVTFRGSIHRFKAQNQPPVNETEETEWDEVSDLDDKWREDMADGLLMERAARIVADLRAQMVDGTQSSKAVHKVFKQLKAEQEQTKKK